MSEVKVATLTVGQALRVTASFQQFRAAEQGLVEIAREIGYDPGGAYRIGDDGSLYQILQDVPDVSDFDEE